MLKVWPIFSFNCEISCCSIGMSLNEYFPHRFFPSPLQPSGLVVQVRGGIKVVQRERNIKRVRDSFSYGTDIKS
jgi:hypothetical protein